MEQKIYDLIIVGGGPAGLTAAIYALRANLSVLLIEKAAPGGQIALTLKVENYPGHLSVFGYELSNIMFSQAQNLGLETVFEEVVDYKFEDIKTVKTKNKVYKSRTIILALGAKERELDVPNEQKLKGKGVSYCATCDGAFFKNKVVAVVGGGNTAFDDCIYLSGLAKKIFLIHRKESFKAEERLVESVKALQKQNGNIEFILNAGVTQINGEEEVTSVDIVNFLTKQVTNLKVDAIFVAIGRKPDTEILQGKINLSKDGYILTDEKMQTNIAGVYSAGDIREKDVRQIVTATSDGAMAAISAHQFVRGGQH